MFPIGVHTWCHVLGMPDAHQLQAQIISRAMKLLRFCPITPAHRKPPWPGYKHGLRLFTKLLVAHPLVGVCLPPEIRPAEYLKLTGYMVGSLFIRGHSAGSYAGMVWEAILAEFPDIEGKTVLAAIALPPSLLTTSRLPHSRQVHLIHHADDRLCVWNPSNQDMRMLQKASTPGVYDHTYHRVASVPGYCPTQLPALDTSHPSTGTTGPSQVGKFPRGAPL